MQLNETNAALRRVYFTIHDLDGNLSTTATATGAELQITVNGAAFTNAAGSLVHVGAGLYYYQATATDASVAGFISVKFEKATFKTAHVWESIGPIFQPSETDAVKRRLPLTIFDVDGALTESATATGAELQVSINGGAYSNSTGSLVAIGDGLYYYQATASDVSAAGVLLVKFAKATFKTTITSIEVTSAAASETTDPTITVVSTPVTSLDPLVINIYDASGLSLYHITCKDRSDGERLSIYDPSDGTGNNGFVHPFNGRSTLTGTGTQADPYVFTIYRRGRWPTGLDLDIKARAVDTKGNEVTV